jgi:hypothetical protein
MTGMFVSGCVLSILPREVSPMVWTIVVLSTVQIKCHFNITRTILVLIFRTGSV